MLWLLILMSCFLTVWCSSQCPTVCVCEKSTVICSNQSLTTFPRKIPDGVENLKLTRNKLTNLTIVKTFSFLETLDVSFNNISTVNFYAEQPNLKTVWLSNNKLCNLSALNFSSTLPSLKTIDFSQNPCIGPLRYIYGLASDSLEVLRLRNCKLTTFEKNFLLKLPNLRELDLSSNNVRDLSSLESSSLNHLQLSHQFGTLNLKVWELIKFSSLISLNASFNEDMHLGFASDLCLFIDNLDLSHSKINAQDFILDSFCQLRIVNISHSSFTSISPKMFIRNPSLLKLNLSHNKLKTIDKDAFKNNSKIYSMDLAHNSIGEFAWTQHLVELKDLDLSHNQIRDFNQLNLISLTHFYLRQNFIQLKVFNLTDSLPNVLHLDLSRNKIEVIDQFISATLKQLILDSCEILNIHKNAFESAANLERIDLTGNKLVSLDVTTVQILSKLNYLGLNHNPWTCSCSDAHFRKLYEFIKNLTLATTEEIRCPSLNNWTWIDACQVAWTAKPNNATGKESIIILLAFVVAAIFICGTILYCKHHNENNRRRCGQSEDAPSLQQHSTSTIGQENFGMRRSRSTPEVIRSVTPPPNYEEACLLPPVRSEVLRMTRSDFTMDRRTVGRIAVVSEEA